MGTIAASPSFLSVIPPPEMFEGNMELGLLEASRLTEACSEPEFETVEYPPRLPPTVNLDCEELDPVEDEPRIPLDKTTFESFFDDDGRLVDEHLLRKAAFKGTCICITIYNLLNFASKLTA